MLYFLDSSALVKRYHREAGSSAIDELFAAPVPLTFSISSLSLCEVVSALNRARNRGEITDAELVVAMTQFYSDTLDGTISIMDITREHVVHANDFVLRYNLRASDAIILSCAVEMQRFSPTFVTSDRRLLEAARQRHFKVLNPEQI